ncbi:hypothetical protein B0H17DRAFT_1060184 [Mycena rosella]|uniref:Uncharacterized protein n=1 Tax=Mycena rosella TaxID=1033263 RepID=A0AAD7DKL2_MYCRO|nr:hypothetical protein B0H17DRAFT_1060184 [Mycena rosella]
MDQNGFDFKALRMNTAPGASSNPSFSNIPTYLPMPQRPTNSRKPFAFIQTQSRKNAENSSVTSTSQVPQGSRHHVDPLRMKQEPNDHASPHARHHPQQQQTLIPQPPNELKAQSHSQSHKLRAFTMMAPTYNDRSSQPYNDRSSQQPFDAPQHVSSPKPSSFNLLPESHNYPHSSLDQSQERPHSPSVPKSRSPSTQFDPDFDAEDADLSQLMTKRMREAKMVKSKLAEQRIATAALESRLSAQTAASDAAELTLKARISELEAREASRQARAAEELRAAKTKTEDAEQRLQEATAALKDTRAAAKSGLDEVGRNYAVLQAYLKDLKGDYNAAQDLIKHMSGELAEIRRSAMDGVKGIETSETLGRSAETRALIDELQNDRASAHQVIDMLRDKLHVLSAQVIEARERVAELEAIREGKIERVGECRVFIMKFKTRRIYPAESKVEELADKLVKKEKEGARGLADAVALEARLHETNEKLLDVSNTLEAKEAELGAFREEKVAWEWEAKEKSVRIASLQNSTADLDVLKEQKMSLEFQLKEQCSRNSALQPLEAEVIALKEAKIVLECGVKEIRSKLDCEVQETRSKIAVLQSLESELATVREEKVALECQIEESHCKIMTLQNSQKDISAKLQQSMDQAQQRDAELLQMQTQLNLQRDTSAKLQQSTEQVHQQSTQLSQLRAELKAAENVKEQLQSSLEASQTCLETSQKSATKLTQEVHALTLREAVLQEKSGELGVQLGKLSAELSKLNSEALAREEELRQLNIRSSVLQERFDSQALTLKLAKEQSGDLQERLLISESSHATKLESAQTKHEVAVGKLNVEIAVLREQKAHFQTTLDQVTEEAATQRAGFLGASVDYENKLHKQEETHAKLVQAEERRVVAAERDADDAKRLVDDLMQQVESGRTELEDAKKKARESMGMEGEVVVLQARLEELEGENSRLQHRARILNKRYKDGDLSDSEKSFVNSLMQMSQSIHEQDIVAKENELRRRENMITSLQTRIDTLESTLARLLKERGKEGGPNSKSMVDLSLWMSSSPRSAQKKPDAQPTASSSNRIPSPTVFAPDTPPVKKSSKAAKPAAIAPPPQTGHRALKTLADIDADDEPLTDSDDDQPLSTTLGKRSRTPTSAKTDEPSRPARRLRAAATRKDPESEKKVADGVKSKQRKRR